MVPKGDDEEMESLSADFLFTIRFDGNGRWSVLKTHEMTSERLLSTTTRQKRTTEPPNRVAIGCYGTVRSTIFR